MWAAGGEKKAGEEQIGGEEQARGGDRQAGEHDEERAGRDHPYSTDPGRWGNNNMNQQVLTGPKW